MSTPSIRRPAASSAWRIVIPSGTSSTRSSTVIFGIGSELEALAEGAAALGAVALEVVAEVAQHALHRPGRGVGEGADRLALHLRRDAEQHREVLGAALAALDALDDLVHPAGALTALRALPARLVAEEPRDHARGAHHAGRVVHDHDAARAEHGLALAQELVRH